MPQSHGGALRVGNPGNAGGGRHPEKVRERLRELLTAEGLPLLERAMRREEVDYRAIVVDKLLKVVALPVDTRVAIVAAQIALEASEGKVSPEKPGLQKRRILEVRFSKE